MNMIKNFSNELIYIDSSKDSIFLAGPTRRNSSFNKSWRNDACKILEKLNYNGIVYIPEFSEGSNYDYLTQTLWERDGLMNAKHILFYIPRKLPDMPAFTTNVEFGYYLAKRPNNIILCSPKDAEKNKYLEWLYTYDLKNRPIYRNLEEALYNICN